MATQNNCRLTLSTLLSEIVVDFPSVLDAVRYYLRSKTVFFYASLNEITTEDTTGNLIYSMQQLEEIKDLHPD